MRKRWFVAVSLLVAACGTGSDPAAPSAPDASAPTTDAAPPPANDAGDASVHWAEPAFDPLTRCASLVGVTLDDGVASLNAEPVVTARFGSDTPGAARLELTTGDGTVYALREGVAGPEILKGETTVATGAGTPSDPGEWMLRIIADGASLRGKAWPAAIHEPSDWQVSFALPTSDAGASDGGASDGGVAASDVARIRFGGADDLRYVLAGLADGSKLTSTDFHDYVSCTATMPSVGPPADGTSNDPGDQADQVEVKSLMQWALDSSAPRLVVGVAGTSSTVDATSVVDCPAGLPAGSPARCITTRFTAMDGAYAALHAAGYTDDDIANTAKVRFTLWGFGDYAKDEDLGFFATGAGDTRVFTVRDLGGANAAMLGPDAAPSANALPWVGTFAYTQEHLIDDAQRMHDAVDAYAMTAPEFAKHTLVIGHSWGAADATALLLREDLDVHVDFGISMAMPKFVAGLDQLGQCASELFFGGCDGILPALDLSQGFYLGPGGIPIYRIDRPDDPVAQATSVSGLITELQDSEGQGTLGGHDYDVRKESSTTLAMCTRTYQDCAVGSVLCTTDHETVSYLPPSIQQSYVGMYGVDSFHVSCNVETGGTLEYWCNDVAVTAGVDCKTLPDTTKVCAAKPTDCP